MKQILLLLFVLASIIGTIGCDTVVSDADISDVPAIVSIDFTAKTDNIENRNITVTGVITLGYTSARMADIRIVDNETVVYASTIAADALTLSFSQDITLPHERTNNLSVFVSYNGQTIKQNVQVSLPVPVTSFVMTPKVSTADRFSVDLSGNAEFGYFSDHPAHLTVAVNDDVVYTENIDVSKQLKHSFACTVPLFTEGVNSITATIEYDGAVLKRHFPVAVNSAIASFSLEPAKTTVNNFSAAVSGTASFGYLSDESAVLTVSVNGEQMFADTVSVSKQLTHDFSFEIPLLSEGDNDIVATLRYGSGVMTRRFTVAVDRAVLSFDVTPATHTADSFSVAITGGATFGYFSNVPAIFTVSVNGKQVHAHNIDVSSQLEHSCTLTIPLNKEGQNDIVATLSYGNSRMVKQFAVTVNPAIASFDCSPAKQIVDRYSVDVSGTVDFGYFSDKSATVSITVNDEEVYTESVSVQSELHKDFVTTIPLSKSGQNRITATVSYGKNSMKKSFIVTVDNAIKSFDISPVSSAVSAFSASLSGSIAFGHIAGEPAVLQVTANGKEVYSRDISVTTSADFAQSLLFDITLPDEGDNLIVASLSYDGVTVRKQMLVTLNDAITSFSIAPVTTVLNDLSVAVNGDISFGYTSEKPALLTITANNREIYSETIDVSTDLSHHIVTTIPVPNEGENVLVASVSYGSRTVTRQFSATVEPPLKGFSLAPSAGTVTGYSASLSGSASFGYHSNTPALLRVFVNGKLLHEEEISVTGALDQTLDVTIPLDTAGENSVVATLSYGSATMSQKSSVSVDLTAPTVTFPATWNTQFAAKTLTVSGDATITSDYPITEVQLSVDNGPFIPQSLTDNGDGTFTAALNTTNPDIGVSTVALKVTLQADGRTTSYFFHDTFSVSPIFDCGDAASMSPSSTMIQQNYWEMRSMNGYFGKPDGGHNISFVITGKDNHNDTYTEQGINQRIGYNTVETNFYVRNLYCSSWPFPTTCDTDYSLSFFVDGTLICHQDNFGVVRTYH